LHYVPDSGAPLVVNLHPPLGSRRKQQEIAAASRGLRIGGELGKGTKGLRKMRKCHPQWVAFVGPTARTEVRYGSMARIVTERLTRSMRGCG
jgi:hypothetical protein